MYLQDLSSEVLALIFDGDFSCLVLMLWKCGNSQLNNKFRYGGVTSMKLEHNRSNGTSRWPRCLKEFSLTSLSIRCINRALCTTASLRRELQQLHGGLKKLEIEAEHVLGAFFPSFDASLISAAVPHHLNSNCSDAIAVWPGNSNLTELWDLNTTWPYMEELSICGERSPRMPFDPIHPDIFGRLPRSLHTFILTMTQDFIVDAYRHYYQLPPKLSKLSLQTLNFELKPIDIRNLPTSLTEILCPLSNSAARDLSRMPSLLPNLTRLAPRKGAHWLSHVAWPPQLHTLSSFSVMAERFFQGPPLPKLKSLLLAQLCISLEKQVKFLPQTLAYLSVERVDFTDIDVAAWPPTLVALHLYDPCYGHHWNHKLPRSLKSLMVTPRSRKSARDFALPITKLLEHGIRSLEDSGDKELWSTLKPKLRDRDFVGGDASAYIDAVESGRLFGLPLSLVELFWIFHGSADRESFVMVLPPQLTSLELRKVPWKFSEWENFFSLIPPSLTKLELDDELDGLCDCVNRWNEESRDPSTTPLYALSNLVRISFFPETGSIDRIGKYLPQNMQELTVNAQSAFDMVQELPPGLLSLTLYEQSDPGCQPWVELLPKSLTFLHCSSSEIPGCELAKLPPKLVELRAHLSDVSLDQLQQMPRGLSRVRLGEGMIDSLYAGKGENLSDQNIVRLVDAYEPFHLIYGVSKASLEMELKSADLNDPLQTDVDPRTIRRLNPICEP